MRTVQQRPLGSYQALTAPSYRGIVALTSRSYPGRGSYQPLTSRLHPGIVALTSGGRTLRSHHCRPGRTGVPPARDAWTCGAAAFPKVR